MLLPCDVCKNGLNCPGWLVCGSLAIGLENCEYWKLLLETWFVTGAVFPAVDIIMGVLDFVYWWWPIPKLGPDADETPEETFMFILLDWGNTDANSCMSFKVWSSAFSNGSDSLSNSEKFMIRQIRKNNFQQSSELD